MKPPDVERVRAFVFDVESSVGAPFDAEAQDMVLLDALRWALTYGLPPFCYGCSTGYATERHTPKCEAWRALQDAVEGRDER